MKQIITLSPKVFLILSFLCFVLSSCIKEKKGTTAQESTVSEDIVEEKNDDANTNTIEDFLHLFQKAVVEDDEAAVNELIQWSTFPDYFEKDPTFYQNWTEEIAALTIEDVQQHNSNPEQYSFELYREIEENYEGIAFNVEKVGGSYKIVSGMGIS